MSSKQLTGQDGDVQAGVVVSTPSTVATTATAHTPHLGRSLVWSAEEEAMRAVFRGYVLAMEATLGSIGLVDVEHLEMVAKKEPADARGWARSRVFQVLPRAVPKAIMVRSLAALDLQHMLCLKEEMSLDSLFCFNR